MKFCQNCDSYTAHIKNEHGAFQCTVCKEFNIFLDKKYTQEHYGQKVR